MHAMIAQALLDTPCSTAHHTKSRCEFRTQPASLSKVCKHLALLRRLRLGRKRKPLAALFPSLQCLICICSCASIANSALEVAASVHQACIHASTRLHVQVLVAFQYYMQHVHMFPKHSSGLPYLTLWAPYERRCTLLSVQRRSRWRPGSRMC